MEKDAFEISRRRVLAGIGGVGAASAGAGMGTSAFFSDEERFRNNRLVAGELDLGVAWQANYFDWSEDEENAGSAEDLFSGETKRGTNVSTSDSDIVLSSVTCSDILAIPDDPGPRTVITLQDVKPGDFGLVAFKLGFCTTNANPGYLWTNSRMTNTAASGPNDENDKPEPEVADGDEFDPFGITSIDGELARNLFVRPFYANSGTAFSGLFDPTASGMAFANAFFDTFQLSPEDYPGVPTLLDFTDALAQGLGLPLSGNPAGEGSGFGLTAAQGGDFQLVTKLDNGGDVFYVGSETEDRAPLGANSTILFGLAWGMPVDHANETQTDSVAFDLGFYTEQARHNSGLGSSIGSLELEKSVDFGGTLGHNAVSSGTSGTGYAVNLSEASFSGISGPIAIPGAGALGSGPQVLVGVHAPDVVGTVTPLGDPPLLDSLVGFTTMPQGGTLGATQIDIETKADFTATISGSLVTELENKTDSEGSVPITATLWHAFNQLPSPAPTVRPTMGIAPAGPVRDVDGTYIQDEDVPVAFSSP